ncbi:MAG: ornithine cyclodeaminase family protein [Actinomycetota bacterium]
MNPAGHPFADRRTRVLGMHEVRELLSMPDVIEIQRRAFIALAAGKTEAAPNSWLRLPGERRGWLKLLAGYDATTSGLGVKVLARFPQNPPGANLGSLLLLFDDDNGFPLAIMDGVYVTAVRTGAGAALATEALARSSATSIGLVGTGVVAWHSLAALKIAVPRLTSLRVFSRSVERRRELVRRAVGELGLEARAAGTVEDALQGADVVVTATNSPTPVLLPHHVEAGQHINAMGIRTEVAPEVMASSMVVGDGREETITDGKFSVALAAGTVTSADLGPELGELLSGEARGRESDSEVTLFDSSGVAIQDVACARYVWERAEEADVGRRVDLGLDDGP